MDITINPRITRIVRYATPKTLSVIHGRPDHALIIRVSKKAHYEFENQNITALRSEVIFLPKGSVYSVHPAGGSENEYAMIAFDGSGFPEEPVLMKIDNLQLALSLHSEMIRLSIFDSEKNRMLMLSHFYRIMSMLSPANGREYLGVGRYSIIEPAIEHLEKYIFSPELKQGELHSMCGVSEVYFRKIFTAYAGMSPKKYITSKRLSKAKELLDEGDLMLVREVSEAVGYTDPLYFSRIYREHFGASPRSDRAKTQHK